MNQSRAPLIVASVLLSLPLLYVGGYLALVSPQKVRIDRVARNTRTEFRTEVTYEHFRLGGSFSASFFWPLQQLDRQLRPNAWDEFAHFSGCIHD